MDPKARMRRLAADDTTWDAPWGGSFAELREHSDLVSSGYNQPDDVREFELIPEEGS